MERKFKDITYDMSKNQIIGGEAISPVHASLVLTIGHHLKEMDLVKEFRIINFETEDYLSDSQVQSCLDNLVDRIYLQVSELRNKELFTYLKSTIRFVIEEIISFIKVNKVYLLEDLHLIMRYLDFNNDGRVNPEKTVLSIFENEHLLAPPSLILATHFYLKDKSVFFYYQLQKLGKFFNLGKEVLEKDIVHYFFLLQIRGSPQYIQHFYDYYFSKNKGTGKGKTNTLNIHIHKKDFIIQDIFRKAVEQNNEMAVQYLWINFVSLMKTREIVMEELISSYMGKSSYLNIVMYLILQADRFELENLFNNKGCEILKVIYNDKRWIGLYFKILNELRRHIVYNEYFFILSHIASSIDIEVSSETDVQFLQRVFFQVPEGERDMLNNQENSKKIYFQLLREPFKYGDFDSAISFLDYCSSEMIDNFLRTDYGIKLLEISIERKKFNFINNILSRFLNKEKKDEIISNFFQFSAFEMFKHLLYFETDKKNKFIKWFSGYVHEKDIKKFKSTFPYEKQGKILKILLFSRGGEYYKPFLYTTEILAWCVGQDNVSKIKLSISLHLDEGSSDHSKIKCYKNVYDLVLRSKWKFLGKLIIWKSCSTLEKHMLGRKLLMDPSLFIEMQRNENVFNYFHEFSDWVIGDLLMKEGDDEMRAFIGNIFNSTELFQPLLRKWDFSGIKKVISWCKPPATEGRYFLSSIMRILETNKFASVDERKNFGEFVEWFISYIN